MDQVIRKIQVAMCVIAGSVLIAACHTALCQEPGPPPAGLGPMETAPSINVDKQLSKMTKRYGLSNPQKTQIRPVLDKEKRKTDALFQDASLSPEDRFESMRAIHKDEVSRVSAILTDDQKKKYLKDQEHAGGDGMDSPHGPPPDSLPPGGSPPDGV